MSFIRKKVKTLTLGEKLRKVRSERRISLNEISKHTKIQLKYLECLEQGKYKELPPDVYVKGFLKSYADFFSIDSRPLLSAYDREKRIQASLSKSDTFTKPREKAFNFVISSRILITGAIILLIFSAIFYLYYEISQFVSEPRLVILSPLDGEEIENPTIRVEGITEAGVSINVNSQEILVDENGRFYEEITLGSGVNVLKFEARNRFDKISSRTISVKNNYAEMESEKLEEGKEVLGAEQSMVEVGVYVTGEPVRLSVSVDGKPAYEGNLFPDVSQSFQVKEEIEITSTKGEATFIKIGDQEPRAVGEVTGLVQKKVFKVKL